MAKCEDKSNFVVLKSPRGKLSYPSIKNANANSIAVPKVVQNEMKNLAQKHGDLEKSEIPLKREYIRIQEKTLTVDENATALGKRSIVIENSSFGPPASERKGYGINLSPDGTELKDNFRYRSGRYWTTDKTGESFIFLAGEVRGEPWSVVDYDFTKTGILKPEDITEFKNVLNKKVPGSFDKLTSNIQNKEMPETSSFFATQQWVLIQANSPYYTIKSSRMANRNRMISYKNQVGALSFSNITSQQIQSGKLDVSDLVFNTGVWKADIQGGTITETTSSTEVTEEEFVFQPTIEENVDFFDHSFEIPLPFSHKELEDYNGFNKPLSFKFEPDYNFYLKKYENVLGQENVPEQILPNVYVLASEFVEEANRVDFQEHITLGNSLELNDAPSVKVTKRAERENNEFKKVTGQYFNKFARKFEELQNNLPLQARIDRRFQQSFRGLPRTQLEELFTSLHQPDTSKQRILLEQRKNIARLENKYSNIIFPIDNLELINKYEDKKRLFPMYVDLEFSTDKTTNFAQMLKEATFSTALQQRVVNGVERGVGIENKSFVNIVELLQRKREISHGIPVSTVSKEFSFELGEYKIWDITEWLNDYEKIDDPDSDVSEEAKKFLNAEEFSVSLGGPTIDEKATNEPNAKFLRSLLKLIFAGKLRKIVKQKMRTFEEMMQGKFAHSETAMYRVEKSIPNSRGEPREVVQNFYLPNSNEIDVFRFVDTQIKYNKKYVYKIYAYQVVYGTKYSYSDLIIEGDLASFLVTQQPSIKLVEVPYCERMVTILDDPPVFPEIEPVSYKDVSNKMAFFLRSNVGSYEQYPITIEPEDEKIIEKIRNAKDVDLEDPIRYETDDHTGVFQVFRLKEKPTKYEDFQGNLLTAVETDVSKITPQSATSATFVDDIRPNIKYYYMFRIVDIHGHISNPSSVYEIEMVDENGMIFPIVQLVDFALDVPKMQTRQGKKYIHIKPALAHTIINEEKSKIQEIESAKDVKNVFLGEKKETVWGKKFKIRITSKHTGKKIDFNLDFTSDDVVIKLPEDV